MRRSEFKRRLSTVMRGTDLKFHVEDTEEISCNLCMSIAFQPVVCNGWENVFWEECYKTFIEEVKSCPLGCDGSSYSGAPENILKKVRNWVFICPNKTNGCTKDVAYDEVAHHELTCPYKLIKCSGYRLCKMMCLRMDLYSHESLCPYSAINHKNQYNEHANDHNDLEGSGCRGCVIWEKRSQCFTNLSRKVNTNANELNDMINNLTELLKRQDEQIKELRIRLEKVEDSKLDGWVDLQKLNHNVNTKVDLEKLLAAQEPESKGWLGAQHYGTIKNSLAPLKDFYEHNDWKILSNLGVLQIYTKKSGEEGSIDIIARCEINHRVSDIGSQIENGHIFIENDPNVSNIEVVQNIGEGINIYYIQFKNFLFSKGADLVVLSQKIDYLDDSGEDTIVFPIKSVNHYKKKATEENERLNIETGGWVLKSLGNNKTLVNVFFNVKFSTTEIPNILLSKHVKSLVSMLRTLESQCNKNFKNYRFGSKIFDKTQTIIMNENDNTKSIYREKDEEEEEKYTDIRLSESGFDLRQSEMAEKGGWTIVPTPSDVPEIDPSTVQGRYKEYVIGTRQRLGKLIDMINNGGWKKVSTKKECKIFIKKGETGLVCVKGETYFPFDAEKIIEYIKRADIRHEYDKYTDNAKIIEEVDHRTIIWYAKVKQILVVASRDLTFATQLITSKQTGCMYTPTYSIELEEYPPQKDPVRAEIPIGGWVLMQTPEGGSNCVYTSELDLKGNIPKFMIEKTADIQVSILTSLRDYMMEKEGLKLGQVWVRPESERILEEAPIAAKAPAPANQVDEEEKVQVSKEETKKTLTKAPVEEKKAVVSNSQPKLSPKSNVKNGTAAELGIETWFSKFTDDDIPDKIDPEKLGRNKDIILRARKSTFQLLSEVNGEYNRLKSQKDIEIFTRDNPGDMGQSVLGVGEIPFSIEKVWEVLWDDSQRKNFDEMLDKAEIMGELEHMTFEIYIMFKRIMILSPRDFMWAGAMVKFADGTVVFPTFSIDREDRPETKKFVRAQLHIGGWVMRPIDDNNTLVYYYNRADMKGSLPAWVMKQGASMQALLISKLRDYMIKKESGK